MSSPRFPDPPQRIRADHLLAEFDSGEFVMDDWLRRRALRNEADGVSRTYVLCVPGGLQVIGYYALSTGAVMRSMTPGNIRRNMPDPIPVMVLGRLAIDRSRQGQGLGQGLLRDAVQRTLQASEIAGIRALLVHALTDRARSFYERFGFRPSPIDSLTLMLRLSDARTAFARS